MKILPESTKPPSHRIQRRHRPEVKTGRRGYQAYRDCLRWEFGFSCTFCLLHETDVIPHGVEGFGVMGVEHFTPVSADAGAVNDYENCFYACRLCNGARSNAPVSGSGQRLLDPCRVVWADHFEAEEDRLLTRPGDRDAEYTERIFDLNDPRKMRARKLRRELLSEYFDLIDEGPPRVEILIELSEKYDDVEILKAAQNLQRCIGLAAKEIENYAAIPFDAPDSCSCWVRDDLALPRWLDRQTLEIDLETDLALGGALLQALARRGGDVAQLRRLAQQLRQLAEQLPIADLAQRLQVAVAAAPPRAGPRRCRRGIA